MAKNNAFDIKQVITDKIVEAIENGVGQWSKSWKASEGTASDGVPRRSTKQPYKGINYFVLSLTAQAEGYASPYWFTFNQCKAMGAMVRKGSKGTPIVFVKPMQYEDKNKPDANGDPTQKAFLMMKHYFVFNGDQIDGLPARYNVENVATPNNAEESHAAVKALIATHDVALSHGGDRAFYSPSLDAVRMPHLKNFVSAEAYDATLLHELTHWTSHDKRCARKTGKKFGDNAYAMEELVAELGAAMLCAQLNVTKEMRPDHAQYIAAWLRILKADKTAIFAAASLAQKAVDYLCPTVEADEEGDEA